MRDFEAAHVVAASTLEKVRTIGDLYRSIGAWMVLGFAALGLGRRSEAREAFAESLDLVLAADTRSDALPDSLTGIALAADTADARSAAQLQGAVNKMDEASIRSPAIPRARAISRAAARRRPRRGRIRQRAGTGREDGYRRGDRPGANARQPGEPRSGRRVLKDRGESEATATANVGQARRSFMCTSLPPHRVECRCRQHPGIRNWAFCGSFRCRGRDSNPHAPKGDT